MTESYTKDCPMTEGQNTAVQDAQALASDGCNQIIYINGDCTLNVIQHCGCREAETLVPSSCPMPMPMPEPGMKPVSVAVTYITAGQLMVVAEDAGNHLLTAGYIRYGDQNCGWLAAWRIGAVRQ